MPLTLHAALKADIQPLKRETLLPPALGVVRVKAMILVPAVTVGMVVMAAMAEMVVVLASLMAPILMVNLISIVLAT